jgi:hypothetical protein
MSKAKKTKAPRRKTTALDRLTAQLRTAFRRESANVIEIGKLLIESRKHLEHGEWQVWLAKNFDLTYRTALNYTNAAEYVSRKLKSETVSLFANVAPTVLYRLAEGDYDEQEEAEILRRAKAGERVDRDLALAICEAFAPPDDDEDDEADDQDGGDEDSHDSDGNDEIEAILDGPPPAVPPPAPNPPPTDFALQDFNQAVDTLNRLKTKKPTQFAKTSHSADVLESVESFINAVTKAIAKGDER